MKVELGPGFTRDDTMRPRTTLASTDGPAIRIEDLFRRRMRRLEGAPARTYVACPLAFTADGRSILRAAEQLEATDVRTGRARALTKLGPGSRYGIVWDLYASPDGRTVLFGRRRPRPERICTLDLATARVRSLSNTKGMWRFACDWETSTLLVVFARPSWSIWTMTLDGRNARRVLEGVEAHDPCIGPGATFATFWNERGVYRVDLRSGDKTFLAGRSPSLSPDGSCMAFMRSNGEVCVRRFDAKQAETIARVEPDEPYREGGWTTPPRWSRDGRYMWFRVTAVSRLAAPIDLEFVAEMRRRAARAAKRRKGSGRMDYEGSIRHASWSFEHANGIVDWTHRTVWLREGHLQDVALL